MNLDLNKVPQSTFAFAFVMVGTFATGFLFLCIFEPVLFAELDIVRLCLLSLAVSYPVFILNAGAVSFLLESSVKNEDFLQTVATVGALISIFMLYFPIGLREFLWNGMETKTACLILFIGEVLVYVLVGVGLRATKEGETTKPDTK